MSSDNLAEPFSVNRCNAAVKVAEREGFEPSLAFQLNRISSAARSTTLPPLRHRPANVTSVRPERKPKKHLPKTDLAFRPVHRVR